MKGKRIEIYKSFEESEKATLTVYAEMTPQQCWMKAHELSDCFRQADPETHSNTYLLFLPE
ncbi:MAG: hypothetical protein JXR41_10030 [Bacteroidales bacterium]|nr:hypothetical protein [Bacteroidales bacterium]MBN2763418.1 hypothetical protein [Bacteroidales bacterium]